MSYLLTERGRRPLREEEEEINEAGYATSGRNSGFSPSVNLTVNEKIRGDGLEASLSISSASVKIDHDKKKDVTKNELDILAGGIGKNIEKELEKTYSKIQKMLEKAIS